MAEGPDFVDAWLTARGELERVFEHLDRQEYVSFAEDLAGASGRVFFTGQGRSGLAAQMAAMRFMHIGKTAHFVGEATAPAVRRGDTLVIVSGSGKTPVSVEFGRVAKAEGASVLLVTHRGRSPLRDLADRQVTIPVAGTVQFGGTLFEQSALVLLDSVVLHMMSTVQDPFALMWHNHTNLQ
jgi:6-phospho-3-hexuloisomerase